MRAGGARPRAGQGDSRRDVEMSTATEYCAYLG
eukprot:SAG31_NODE_237_length_19590_cov_13.149915_9_plen_33_part_00